ncbi:Gim5A protein [Trypanosoma rangeli]|uniref:Gim5A protein n=1 Tax=Trypanosoma rangeli TaxID=5698 RepID=A0A3R7K892_TRYRA|nr:Gim5A protein [Trypanosoma rangeli]RNE95758.1 Gim5A protein [Trypanosoma rangeli]|eukprot:RNE95758.1 Gim5A protein [Trypanosoma rangeli]
MKVSLLQSPHSRIWSRDRVPAIVQFCSLILSGLAGWAGHWRVARSAKSLSKLLKEYQCVTRLCDWLVVFVELSPSGMRRTMRTSPAFFTAIARILTTICLGLFLASEEVELLASVGVVNKMLWPYASRLVPAFFFYYNFLKAITSAVLLQAMHRISFEATDTRSVSRKLQYKEMLLSFLGGIGYMVYAMTLLPSNAPRLREALHEDHYMYRIYSVLSSLCPQALQVRPATQGFIGLLATVPFLFLS